MIFSVSVRSEKNRVGGHMKKQKGKKRVRMHPIVKSPDGKQVLMEVCQQSLEEGEPRKFAVGRLVEEGKPLTPGGEYGTYHEGDDCVEFEPLDTESKKISYEDKTARKGPSKHNSAAFRDGWARTFAGGGGN